jgi:hypothetical protein
MNALFGNLIAENWNGLVRYDVSDLMRDYIPRVVEEVDLLDAKLAVSASLAAEFDAVTTPYGASVFSDAAFTKDIFYVPQTVFDSGADGVFLLGNTSPLTDQDFDAPKFSTLPVESVAEVSAALELETVFEATNVEMDAMMVQIMSALDVPQAKAAPFEQVWDINPVTGAITETLDDPNSDLA